MHGKGLSLPVKAPFYKNIFTEFILERFAPFNALLVSADGSASANHTRYVDS